MKISRKSITMSARCKSRCLLTTDTFKSVRNASSTIRMLINQANLTKQCQKEIRVAVNRQKIRKEARAVNESQRPIYFENRILRESESRLTNILVPLVLRLYRGSSSRWVGGDTVVRIKFSDESDASGESVRVWADKYNWSGNDAYLYIAVSRLWRSQIGSIDGLACAGEMLTTHAELIAPDTWKASWVRQGRGFSLTAENGIIIRASDDTFVHAKSLAAARRLAQKRKNEGSSFAHLAVWDANVQSCISAYLKKLSIDETITRFGHVRVTLKDSYKAGNCPSGTANFVERYFPKRNQASIDEILRLTSKAGKESEIYKLSLLACQAAIIRQRRSIQKDNPFVFSLSSSSADAIENK